MNPRTAIPAIAAIIANATLFAQSDFEYSLSSRKGNKIVLLGDWKAPDLSKWKETLDSEAIYGHGFQLLTRDKLIGNPGNLFVLREGNIPAFEQWIKQKYGLANSAKWAALGMDNKLIVAGAQAPSAKEFDEMLMQKGVKTPQRILRDFLRENPGHVDAMTDLLEEVRRRALHVMPPNPTEDLGTEKDLLTWAVMSTETDKVFSGDWLGIDIAFFRPDKVQPERYSKLMRDVFKKHIPKVEQAIALNPMNGTLWNIWAWMAQCSPDYKISPFINSIEPGIFPSWNSYRTFPPKYVCAWIIEEAKAKKDWNTVVKFAKAAQYFRGSVPTGSSAKTEWSPSHITKFAESGGETMKDYLARAYAAHLEALLRLGNIDEANSVYDEMIRKEGKTDRLSTNITVNGETKRHRAENALIAANAARAAGMEDLAKIWEAGEQINKVPYVMNINDFANGFPSWYFFAQSGKSYSDGFPDLVRGLVPALRAYSANPLIIDGVAILDSMASMGWKADDGDRWALIAGDMSAIEQGYGQPEPEVLQAMLKRHNIKDEAGYRRDYMTEHGARPGLEIDLAFTIIDSVSATLARRPDKGANIDKEEDVWAEARKLINKVLSDNPEILINLPSIWSRGNSANSIQTPAMKALSTKLLANIEWLLEKKPSEANLWNQWLFWRWVEGSNRPIEQLVESAKASPISKPGTVPPVEAMDAYYGECKKNEEWPKVISLLRVVWDREFARITDIQKTNPNFKVSAPAGNPSNLPSMAEYEAWLVQQWNSGLGDSVVIPLMEAYLHDGKPSDAKDIFDAWLGLGGTFKDISKIVELARKLGQERLAVEWEGKVKK